MASIHPAERVLIVEDEPSTRSGLTELVRTWGFTTDAAADGQEALDRVAERPYDHVFLDLRMPRVDGITVLRRLQEIGGMTRIVIVTGFVDDLLHLDPERDWPITVIPKPFRLEQVRTVLAPIHAPQPATVRAGG